MHLCISLARLDLLSVTFYTTSEMIKHQMGSESVNHRDVATHVKGLKKSRFYRSSEVTGPNPDIQTVIDLRTKKDQLRYIPPLAKATRIHRVPFVGRKAGLSILANLPLNTLMKFIKSKGSEVIVGEFFFSSPDNLVQLYVLMAENAAEELRRITEILADPSSGRVLVHCVAGKDRTGICVALFARLCGAQVEDIAFDYSLSQENLSLAMKSGLLNQVDPTLHSSLLSPSPWETMVAFLRTLETRYGSTRAFFESKLGIHPDLLDAVIENLKD